MLRTSLAAALLTAALALADSAAGLSWTPPGSWKSLGERPMRAATYNVPAAPGDSEPGECGVFYFGPGQGGSVQANLDRWLGQIQPANGKPAKEVAQTKSRVIKGLKVTTVDVSGAYSGMGGPMAATRSTKQNYRLLGAIVEGPQGAVFFKFTGPAKTVAANQASFDQLLASLKRG